MLWRSRAMGCPPKPGSVSIIFGFNNGVRVSVPLDTLTDTIRVYRSERMATREELKAKRAKAMAVVGQKQDAMGEMYDRVISYGSKVDDAIAAAEAANTGALDAQVGDLKEMIEDLGDFAQAANPTTGASGGTSSSPASAPVKTAATAGTAALAALQLSQPNPSPKTWDDGNAYHGTEGELRVIKAGEVGVFKP